MNTIPKPMSDRPKTHFDQIEEGEVLVSQFKFSEEDIIHFAEHYDRQDKHICPHKAKDTRFGGLIASGWHTAAVTIDILIQEHIHLPDGMLGMGIEHLRWMKPVWPDELMTARYTVIEKRLSKSLPGEGIAKFRCELENEKGETVLEMVIPTILKVD